MDSSGCQLPLRSSRIYCRPNQDYYLATDRLGHFYALVPRAYYLTVEKKNPDETYTLVHTSPYFGKKRRDRRKGRAIINRIHETLSFHKRVCLFSASVSFSPPIERFRLICAGRNTG